MDWADELRIQSDGPCRLSLYHQAGRDFCRLSDADDVIAADANESVCVCLSGMDAFLRRFQPPLNRAIWMKDASPLRRCMDTLLREAADRRAYANEAASFAAGLALIEFLRSAEDEAVLPPTPSQRADAAVRRMLNEYRHPWRVDELSALAGVSSSYLTKFCRREYGKSPLSLLLDKRLRVAVSLLSAPGATVGRVCEAAGFSDVYYFSRLFRRKLGRPPRDYLSKAER